MKAEFMICVHLDPDVLAVEATRHGLSVQRAFDAVVSDLENRLCDSVKFRDGVLRVGATST